MRTPACLLPLLVVAGASPAADPPPVKVFLLAGQSNMQGHGHVRTLDWLGEDPTHGHLLKKVKDGKGGWVTREDVWVAYPARKKYGKLTVGYGVNDENVGPELMFGHVMGDHFDGQVLLIKTAWGGRSVAKDFRPPSSGGEVGPTYKEMIQQVKDVLGDLKTHFPDYRGQGYELAGFVWFQGWNDMINPGFTAEYTTNLANLIRDLRKELKAPGLPVVIGELGVDGPGANEKIQAFREAQAAVARVPEFQGNVAFVPTAQYWDEEAEAILKKYWVRRKWTDEAARKRFERMGNQPPYHYLGSARIYSLVGYGLAEGMKALVDTVGIVIAHRGSSIDRPENTLAAVRRAVEAGASAVEVDVRTSRDGVLVCLHDADLGRTTDGKGKVGDHTLAELKALDAGSWFSPEFKGERIPTVREVLRLGRGKVDVMLDLKESGDGYDRKVAAEVRASGDERRTLLGVRSVGQAKLLRELLPEARQVGLIPATTDIDAFAGAGVEIIRLWPHWLGGGSLVARLRRHKVGLLVGAGKGTREEVLPLLSHRPAALSSDDPARLRKTLAEIAREGKEGR